MKKISIFLALFLISNSVFAYEMYDAVWCRKNGGEVEFDSMYNINFNCTTKDKYETPFAKKVYQALSIPMCSAILNQNTPVFLEILCDCEVLRYGFLDKFLFKITSSDLKNLSKV